MAAVLHAPGDLRYEKADIPGIGPEDALIKVKAAGNCGSDLQRIMVEGTYHFPCIPGHEFSGEIAEKGVKIKGFNVGDRVTAAPLLPCMRCEWCFQGQYNMCENYDYLGSRSDGAFAEYVKVPKANLIRLPENVDYEDGAMTDPAAVALHAIMRAGGILPGHSVVILGSGPIGMFCCQWAKIMGADRVLATDLVEEKLKILKGLGVDVTINSEKEDVVKRVLVETDGRGADIIFETAGSVETHKQSLLAVRKRGKIIHIGRVYSDVLLPEEIFAKIFRKELNIFGAVNSNFSPHDHEWKTVLHYMNLGWLKTKPLISYRLPLIDIADIFKRMYKREVIYNKIIFSP